MTPNPTRLNQDHALQHAFVPLRNSSTRRTGSISPATSIHLGSTRALMLMHCLTGGFMVLYFQYCCGCPAVVK